MAPARKVRDLHCRDTFGESARAVLLVRLAEVEDRRRDVLEPDDPQALHDLRIAAKRLRYSLETFSVCLPDGMATDQADRVRDLQDVLGRIHDLDALRGLLTGRIEQMDAEARRRGVEIATGDEDDSVRQHELQELVWSDERHSRLGLYSVIAAKADERREAYQRFVSLWGEWQESGLLESIRAMITGAPAPATHDEAPIPAD
jgi:hypothetical protein